MKFNLLTKLLVELLSKERVTAKDFADRNGISVRSVYRYAEDLSSAGVPVKMKSGPKGGIFVDDSYRLPSGFLNEEEYSATINALSAMSSQVDDKVYKDLIEKFSRYERHEHRDYVNGNIIVDGSVWGDQGSFSEKMKICERAVNESQTISINYISRDGKGSRRKIDPHVLILKQNVWYVYAYCHTREEFRTFRIARIKSASFTGETFVKKPLTREDIPLDFWYKESELADVVLRIEPGVLPDVEEWLGIENIEDREGYLRASVRLPDDEATVNRILSFGGGVKVLFPDGLRERVREAARRIYDDNSV